MEKTISNRVAEKIQKKHTKEEICNDCEKSYEPDQYYFWCNKCGEEREKSFWRRYNLKKVNK